MRNRATIKPNDAGTQAKIQASLRHVLCFLPLLSLLPVAVSAVDKSGVTPNTVSLPKGPGSIEGLGEAFEPLLALKDPDREEQSGALLVAELGEGTYVYTGLSFFRELPAGVPGAYRLFANLLALGEKR